MRDDDPHSVPGRSEQLELCLYRLRSGQPHLLSYLWPIRTLIGVSTTSTLYSLPPRKHLLLIYSMYLTSLLELKAFVRIKHSVQGKSVG